MTLLTCPPLGTLHFRVSVSPLLVPNGNGLLRTHKAGRYSMFLKTKPVVKDGVLSFNGTDALTGVPDNVVLTPCSESSAFLGATSTESSSRHVFKLGVIKETRLLSLYRFKIWWMIPRAGNSASDIPIETQMLLLEGSEESSFEEPNGNTGYIVFLPFLDGEMRSSLQGNSAGELEVCVETGDPAVLASESLKAVFVNYGNNPFDLMNESMKCLVRYLELIMESMDGMNVVLLSDYTQDPSEILWNIHTQRKQTDWFGWCTWDAFYHDVNPEGIKEGLDSLSKGGTPARFLIIDDGWQDTTNEFQKEDEPFVEGSQFGARLVGIIENKKFRKISNEASDKVPTSLKEFVSDIKRTFGLKYVYVWHALMGYWGGLHLDAPQTQKYNPTLKFPVQSPGNLAHIRDIAMDSMEKYGVGTIDPAKIYEFYDDLHSYLSKQGVDGVKVDVQNIVETVATGSGGRVKLTRHFQEALENSIARNFQDNSIICCMGQNTDSVYNSKKSAITRASDDYYPRNPNTQTLHIAAVAYNSIFLGEVVVPDWDMFYSHHDAAEFHAIARAVGGCGVYVSDKPGQHDFNILRRLVLPDGSVLRAKYPGRPARDCLFCDPVMDGKSLLKIWNVNKCTGVIGIFNCQGAGSWPGLKNSVQIGSPELSGKISPADVEYFEEVSGKSWLGDCAVFSFKLGSLFRLAKHEKFEVSLGTLQCDIFTVSPIKVYGDAVKFAPIGLMNMFNCGGAVEAIDAFGDSSNLSIRIKGRGGGGIFGAYTSRKPKMCFVNTKAEAFEYRSEDHLLSVGVATATNFWDITVHY